jgi:16S rRNA (guanine527-N7)-methyltransferase
MDNWQNILDTGLCELNIEVDNHQREKLYLFLDLIEKWNRVYNLTAFKSKEEMVRLHLLDSLTLLPYLPDGLIVDVGTGAGLPGIPLAILRPDIVFTLLDANSKKTRFVQQAVLELNLKNVTVVHARVEAYTPERNFDAVICRAFASLMEIREQVSHLKSENGCILAMKGQVPTDELGNMTDSYKVIPLEVPGISDQRCLVRLGGVFV